MEMSIGEIVAAKNAVHAPEETQEKTSPKMGAIAGDPEVVLESEKLDFSGLNTRVQDSLAEAGVETAEDVMSLGLDGLQELKWIGCKTADNILDIADPPEALKMGEFSAAPMPHVSVDTDGYARIADGFKVVARSEGNDQEYEVEFKHGFNYAAWTTNTNKRTGAGWVLKTQVA